MIRITELWIYPVKGLRGTRLERSVLEPWGLMHDRRWMIVDARERFLSQREVPLMATIGVEVIAGGLRIAGPGPEDGWFEVATPDESAATIPVTVWSDTLAASAASPAADVRLSGWLGQPCRLVHMRDPTSARLVDPAFAAPTDRVSFADGFSLLVTNEASLRALQEMPGCRAMAMTRFRPNIVIDGASPWEEDNWRVFRVESEIFRVVKPCARCSVTTIDQETGRKSPDTEPLRSLATFRRDAKGKVIFGQNVIPDGMPDLHVGDELAFPET